MLPGRGKPIYSNFTQRDSITEALGRFLGTLALTPRNQMSR